MKAVLRKTGLILCMSLSWVTLPAYHQATNQGKGKLIKSGFMHQSRKRTFLLYFPGHYSPVRPSPLVIALHGRYGNASGMIRFSQFNLEADKWGFMVAYPDGFKRSWHDARGCGPAAETDIDDVDFISTLIDTLIANYPIDKKRIYVAGMSNGGYMAATLACSLSGKIAAAAAVAGSMAPLPDQWCNPSDPISMLFMSGTQDPIVPYAGGQIVNGCKTISFDEAIEFWIKKNNCNAAPIISVLPDNRQDGTIVRVISYQGCARDAEVLLYEIKGGGHTWPGGAQYLPEKRIGRVCHDIKAEEVISDFFMKHSL